MKYVKMFIAGMAFPSLLLPFLFVFLGLFGKGAVFNSPFVHLIPLFWGTWNILYFQSFLQFLPKNQTINLLITGAALGFLIAFCGLFFLHIPELIGIPDKYVHLPLAIGPVLYALVWLFVVKPLNDLLGVSKD